MAKMTSYSKDRLHTTQLVFVRREIDIRTIAIAAVVTARKISVQTAMKKLEAAITDWVKHSQSGTRCYKLRPQGLNIGDLSLYEQEFTTGINTDFLRKQGILDFNIQYVGELSEGTFNFDRILYKG